jgi:heme/copper-type cytochrome/quinol oxidase subunit 2
MDAEPGIAVNVWWVLASFTNFVILVAVLVGVAWIARWAMRRYRSSVRPAPPDKNPAEDDRVHPRDPSSGNSGT